MRFSEPVRMADGGEHSPVWARTKRRSGGNALVGIIVTFLALFGVLTAVLGVKEQSLAEGGAMMDSWITKGVATVRGVLPGGAEAAAAADVAEPATGTAGPAAVAGAAAASDGMKKE
jgi:hypothetical protein